MESFPGPQRVRDRHPPQPMTLSAAQIDRIMTVADSDSCLFITRDVVQVLLDTGLRLGELRDLGVSDIDVANKRLFLSRGKTGELYISLTPRALNALQSLHGQFPGSAYVMGDKGDAVLTRVSLHIRKISAEWGPASAGLHSLRSFFKSKADRH